MREGPRWSSQACESVLLHYFRLYFQLMETAYDYSSSKQTLYFVNIRAKSWIETAARQQLRVGAIWGWDKDGNGKNKFQEEETGLKS